MQTLILKGIGSFRFHLRGSTSEVRICNTLSGLPGQLIIMKTFPPGQRHTMHTLP